MSPARPRYEMPDYIREALSARGLIDAYRARPPYQQNDYIGWITRAKLEATKKKRLNQMLDELERGGSLHEDELERVRRIANPPYVCL
jgi:uncharacterized protein YdeI (YjbR/CyaY-like superfamily)